MVNICAIKRLPKNNSGLAVDFIDNTTPCMTLLLWKWILLHSKKRTPSRIEENPRDVIVEFILKQILKPRFIRWKNLEFLKQGNKEWKWFVF